MTDADLIEASCRGDRDAYGVLVERYLRMIEAVAYSAAGDHAIVDDVVQDTFVAAWQQLDRLRDRARLRPWLCGIAMNLARKTRRRRGREAALTDVAGGETPFEAAAERESAREMADALATLSPRYREPLVLFYYEQCSVKEVAITLAIREDAAMQRLSRGRKQLGDALAARIEEALERQPSRKAVAAAVLAALPLLSARLGHAAASGHTAMMARGVAAGRRVVAAVVSAGGAVVRTVVARGRFIAAMVTTAAIAVGFVAAVHTSARVAAARSEKPAPVAAEPIESRSPRPTAPQLPEARSSTPRVYRNLVIASLDPVETCRRGVNGLVAMALGKRVHEVVPVVRGAGSDRPEAVAFPDEAADRIADELADKIGATWAGSPWPELYVVCEGTKLDVLEGTVSCYPYVRVRTEPEAPGHRGSRAEAVPHPDPGDIAGAARECRTTFHVFPDMDMSMRVPVLLCVVFSLIACRTRRADSEPTRPPAHPEPLAQSPLGPKPARCPSDAVMTTGGCVRGEHAGAVSVFRGIPYAAPPIGALRWKPPGPVQTWSTVRDAVAFGRSCPQGESIIGGSKVEWNEDCLTLNVWTPHADPKAALPVMVWIHGGGLAQGGSALSVYDGQHLASKGNVVVVSINYRLGALGFLAHPALTAEDAAHHASGNFGLHDQLAALAWVQRDVAGFGGDPHSVTIFGESAGGESVCALMSTPLAKGLFTRAVIESAQCVGYGKPLRALHTAKGKVESGEEQGLRVAKALGCEGDAALDCMRGKSAEQIIASAPATAGFFGKGEHFGFTVDGWALTDAPADLLERGQLANVPTMFGTNADEGTLFTAKIQLKRAFGLKLIVKKLFPDAADRVLAQYSVPAYGSAKQAFDALVTDLVFTCPTRRAVRALRSQQPHVYRYLFSHVTEKNRQNNLGATHGSELSFVFGTTTAPTETETTLSTAMLGYWTHFAHTGDPGGNANGAGNPRWPSYDRAKDSYLEFGDSISAHDGLRTSACDVLDQLAPAEPNADTADDR